MNRKNHRRFKSGITHSGQFHADEVLASAFLIVEGFLKRPQLQRRNPTPEELQDPDIIIFDVGGVYDAAKENFDHHEDGFFESSCEMIFLSLMNVSNEGWKTILYERLFCPVSKIDRGEKDPTGISLNSIVRCHNSLRSGFNKALDTTIRVYKAYKATAIQAQEGEERWASLESKGGRKSSISSSHRIYGSL